MKIFIQIHVSILQEYNIASKAIYSRIVDFDKLVQISNFSLRFNLPQFWVCCSKFDDKHITCQKACMDCEA